MKTRNSRTDRKNSTSPRIRGTSSHKTAVPMARKKDIPAGKYCSKIVKISCKKTLADEEAVEVVYDLTAPDGVVRKMREVIPCDSWPFERFCDALLAAGLEEDSDITDAVGVTEEVSLVYETAHGLGHFAKRVPINTVSSSSALANDEDDENDGVSASFDDEDELVEDDEFDFDLD